MFIQDKENAQTVNKQLGLPPNATFNEREKVMTEQNAQALNKE